MKICKSCKAEIDNKAVICPKCGVKIKKTIFKKLWFWILIIAIIGGIAASSGSKSTTPTTNVSMENIEYITVDANTMLKDLTENALKAEKISKVSLIAFTQNDIGNAFWRKIGWTQRLELNYYDFVLNTESAFEIIKNEFEEGTGHHSVIKLDGEYYAIYHGRDYDHTSSEEYVERRTARICKLSVADGTITADRFCDHL